MRYFLILTFFLNFLVGCTHFFTNKPKDSSSQVWINLWKAACESSQGKGQIFLPNRTYAFSYETVLNEKEKWWALVLDAPLRGEETLIVPWDENKTFEGSLIQSIDLKTKKSLTPELMQKWKQSWLSMIYFLKKRASWSEQIKKDLKCLNSKICQGHEGNIYWLYGEDKIQLSFESEKNQSNLTWSFKRKADEYFFSEQIVTLRHQKNSQTISLHLYPTQCSN